MIKIMFIIPTLDAGGAERQLLLILKSLEKRIFEIHAIILKKGGIFENEIPEGISVVFLKNYKKFFKSVFFIKKYINRNRIKYIHTMLPTGNIFGAALKLLLQKKTVFIVSQRGIHHKYFNKWTLFNLISHRLADIVVVNSQSVKKNCIDFLKITPSKIQVIANSIDIHFFNVTYSESKKTKMGFNRKIPLVLSIGRFDELKGHQILIKSVIEMLNCRRELYLVIVGGGPERRHLSEMVEREGFEEYIKIFPKTNNVLKYYEIANIFCLATFSEGLSNVILEAMAAGLPVITTCVPANKELINNGIDGILLQPGDYESFSRSIIELITNQEKRTELGINARVKVKNHFLVKNMIRKYEHLYLDIL